MVSNINFCKLIPSKHTKRHKINARVIGVAAYLMRVRCALALCACSIWSKHSSLCTYRALCSPSRPRWLHRWAVVKHIMHFAWSGSSSLCIYNRAPGISSERERRAGVVGRRNDARGGILCMFGMLCYSAFNKPLADADDWPRSSSK